jgi:hypothetical protein
MPDKPIVRLDRVLLPDHPAIWPVKPGSLVQISAEDAIRLNNRIAELEARIDDLEYLVGELAG